MQIFIARHGATPANLARLIQGQSDKRANQLGEMGRNQAACLRDRLKGEQIQRIDCSNLGRVINTAVIIGTSFPGLIVHQHKALRERSMGPFEGRPITEYKEVQSKELEEQGVPVNLLQMNGNLEGVESIPQIIERLRPYIAKLFTYNLDTVLIVASAVVNLSLIHLIAGIPHQNLGEHKQSEACLNLITASKPGDGQIVFSNSTEHLNSI